jgi:hypothetical protein
VNRSRHELLPDSAFAHDEDGERSRRGTRNGAPEIGHRCAYANQLRTVVCQWLSAASIEHRFEK